MHGSEMGACLQMMLILNPRVNEGFIEGYI